MITKRGNVWHMDFIVQGERVRGTTGCRNKADARAFAEAIKVEKERAFLAKLKGDSFRLADAVTTLYNQKWKGQADGQQTRQRMDRVVEILGNPNLEEINNKMVSDLRLSLERQGLAVATVNRHMAHLKTLLRWACIDRELIPRVPKVPMKAEHNLRERVMTEDEERALLKGLRRKAATAQASALYCDIEQMIAVMLDTMIRPKELKRMTDDMVDLEAKVIRLSASITKNKKARVVPLTDRAFGILKQRMGTGRPFPYSRQRLSKTFAKAKTEAGIVDDTLVPYICRHTGITRLIERGVDLYTVGQIAGHSHSSMTERYGHLCLDSKRNAIDKLNGNETSA